MKYLAFIAALFASTAAFAADIPTKAPPVQPFQYPQASGWYAMVGTEGGGGSVSISAPGVNTNSLVSNSIGINIGVGYTQAIANSSMFWALEGSAGYTNFNGSAPGLSWSGPLEFDFRGIVSAPINQIAAFFPSLGITMPSLSGLPAGFTAVSSRYYIGAGFDATDNSLAFGSNLNKVWGFAPTVYPAGMLVQLTNGSAADIYTKVRLNENGICTNSTALGMACGRANVEVLAGLKYKFGL